MLSAINKLKCPYCKKANLYYRLATAPQGENGVYISSKKKINVSFLFCKQCQIIAETFETDINKIVDALETAVKEKVIEIIEKQKLAILNNVPVNFGEIFKSTRKMLKIRLTLRQIANNLNTTPAHICAIEAGKDYITDKAIAERWLKAVTWRDFELVITSFKSIQEVKKLQKDSGECNESN